MNSEYSGKKTQFVSLATGTFRLEINRGETTTGVHIARDERLVARAGAFAGKIFRGVNPLRHDKHFEDGFSTGIRTTQGIGPNSWKSVEGQLRVAPAAQEDGTFSPDALDVTIHAIGYASRLRDIRRGPHPTIVTPRRVHFVVDQPTFAFPQTPVGENIIVPLLPRA